MTWSAALAPLRNRNFAWYFASRFANTLGTMMANIALAFAVLDIDGLRLRARTGAGRAHDPDGRCCCCGAA